MVRNPIVTLLLGLVPGLGHWAADRKGRAFIYAFFVFGIAAGGFLLGVVTNEMELFAMSLVIAFLFWLVNMLDLVIYLLRYPNGKPSPEYHAAYPPYGPQPFPGYGGAGFASSADGSPPPPSAFDGGASGFGAGPGHAGHTHGPGAYGPPPPNYGMPARRDDAGERFLTILLSFIPGLGHLSLGLMQRGLTFMIGFFGLLTMILFVTALSGEGGFLVFLGVLPIIWLYGLFDAIRMVRRKQSGEPLLDRSIMEDWDDHRAGGRRSRLFATVLSILPGAGHMYLGLQRRGLQLMAGFLLSIYLLDTLELSLFLFLVPILWCYAFFDSLQMQSRYAMDGFVPDVPIVSGVMHQRKWLGLALIAMGLYYVGDRLLLDVFDVFGLQYWAHELRYYFKTGFTALLLLGAGAKLLLGGKAREELAH
ncbi:hypothetical protein BCM02_104395 [Paenibacillus methanolicus]|uniref:Multi-tm2 domain protein n=2 Tax=Paenibacillus methanolicus TaxID=582686 RepID=A0A5S5C8P8_9BACL|nr:hypothetical protein BCM02_104395 [Paenibacillus methanolicus]